MARPAINQDEPAAAPATTTVRRLRDPGKAAACPAPARPSQDVFPCRTRRKSSQMLCGDDRARAGLPQGPCQAGLLHQRIHPRGPALMADDEIEIPAVSSKASGDHVASRQPRQMPSRGPADLSFANEFFGWTAGLMAPSVTVRRSDRGSPDRRPGRQDAPAGPASLARSVAARRPACHASRQFHRPNARSQDIARCPHPDGRPPCRDLRSPASDHPATRGGWFSWRVRAGRRGHIEPIVSIELVNQIGGKPSGQENADNDEAEIVEIHV